MSNALHLRTLPPAAFCDLRPTFLKNITGERAINICYPFKSSTRSFIPSLTARRAVTAFGCRNASEPVRHHLARAICKSFYASFDTASARRSQHPALRCAARACSGTAVTPHPAAMAAFGTDKGLELFTAATPNGYKASIALEFLVSADCDALSHDVSVVQNSSNCISWCTGGLI